LIIVTIVVVVVDDDVEFYLGKTIVVPHVQNALYYGQKPKSAHFSALYYMNALHVFLGFSFP